jgi:hypothetical protein
MYVFKARSYLGGLPIKISPAVCIKQFKNIWMNFNKNLCWFVQMPIPVVALSKAWICGRSLTGIAGSSPTGGMDVSVLWVLCVVR